MKKILSLLFVAVLCCAFSSPAAAKVMRLGYLEAGTFWTYTESLNALMNALQDPGMAAKMDWRNTVTIPEDARFSPGWGNTAGLEEAAQNLMSRKDLDLILVAGTDATAAILKANNGKTPIVSFSVADAIKSGFVKSEKDSGVKNFTVRLVPGRYKRMFKVFYDIVGYKRLGIMYHPSESAMLFSNVADARAEYRSLKRIRPFHEACPAALSGAAPPSGFRESIFSYGNN